MDMGTSTMTMAATTTATSTAAAATTSAMSMDMEADCKISMLWNWYTVDSCFIASSWHITSHGMFAGSCIGVILLVMSLEFLRRVGKEYDRYILRQHQRSASFPSVYTLQVAGASKLDSDAGNSEHNRPLTGNGNRTPVTFRPNVVQQAVRATLHMLQFSVAYFVMLLAMYFNGYFIICIVIGAWLGAFMFSWESVSLGGPKEEVTVCCG